MKLSASLLVPIVLIGILSGCSGLSTLPTYWGSSAGSDDIKPTGFHADTRTGWMSYNDSSDLYFAFSFFDPMVQTLVLRNGMTVFLDPSGKMKQDCYVRFPMIKREIYSGVTEGQRLAQQQGRPGRQQRTTTQALLDQAQGFELQWKNGDEFLQVNPSLEGTDFHTFIAVDSAGVLNIIVGVPITRLNPGGLDALDEMVVGLRFGVAANEQQDYAQPARGGQMPAAGGGGGGRGGRGGGGGRSGGGGTTAPAMGAPTQGGQAMGARMPATTEFWYKTKVQKR
ncbi:MAG: hypothetical protein R6V75_04670 [Bacteroidales bacterium]